MLVFDYFGYGLNSPGSMPGERTCFEDAEVVFDYLINELKVRLTYVYVHTCTRARVWDLYVLKRETLYLRGNRSRDQENISL